MENKLKYFRELQGLSQKEVADKLFVTRQTVSNWENNHNMPPLMAIKDLSILYKVSIPQLIGEDITIMKKKINFFALFGFITFNVTFGAFIGMFTACILFAGWLSTIMFSFAPIILGIAEYQGQAFSWTQTYISIGLMIIGIPLAWLMYKITIYIFKFIFTYLKYSFGSIFYETKLV